MLPDAYLDHEVVADRASLWQQRFSDPERERATLTVLAELDGELAGFAHSILDEDAEWGTLLDNLHVRHDAMRLGIGARLMAETAAALEGRARHAGLYLWVLEANVRARRFYDAMGGRLADRSVSPEGGGDAPSLRYAWPQLSILSSRLPSPRAPLG
jgi:GNAT superfamily N-acetyltransferase